jgi:hypothetical protein
MVSEFLIPILSAICLFPYLNEYLYLPKSKDTHKDIMAPLYDAVTPDFIQESEWKYHNDITIYNLDRVRHRKPNFNYRINYERTHDDFQKRKERRLEKIKHGGIKHLTEVRDVPTTRTFNLRITLRRLKRYVREIKPGDITLEDLIKRQTDLSTANHKYYFKKFPWSFNNNKPRKYPVNLNKEIHKLFKAIISFPVKFIAFPEKQILPFSTDTKIEFPIIKSPYIPKIGNFNSKDFFSGYEPFQNNRLFETNVLFDEMPFIQNYLQHNALLAIRNHLTINKLYRGTAVNPDEIDQYYGGSYSIQPFDLGLNASESVLWRSIIYPFRTEVALLVRHKPWINLEDKSYPYTFAKIGYPKALSLNFRLNQDNLDTFTEDFVQPPKIDLYNTKKHLEGAIEKAYLAKIPVFKPITFTLSHVLEPEVPNPPELYLFFYATYTYLKLDPEVIKKYSKEISRVRLDFESTAKNTIISEWFYESLMADKEASSKIYNRQNDKRRALREAVEDAKNKSKRGRLTEIRSTSGSNNVGDGSVNQTKQK